MENVYGLDMLILGFILQHFVSFFSELFVAFRLEIRSKIGKMSNFV